MFVERFFVEGLAHASYLFGQNGEAAVVDPRRDVEAYLEAAAARGVTIAAIFETHPHADFVSGHLDLAARTGAPVYVSDRYPAEFPHRDLAHGAELSVGGLRVQGLFTPGHSPDSLSILVEGETDRAVFSGDVLFVGDVGRPDLRDMHSDPQAMASALYDTLHDIFWKLPDDTVVYPAHGAGSLCGRRLGSAPSTTIAAEKAGNWVNQFEDRTSFVTAMVENLPDRPRFFFHCPFVNLRGPRLMSELPPPRALTPEELREQQSSVRVIDTRDPASFGAAHLAGSLGVGLHVPLFSTWVGTFLNPEESIVLVVGREQDAGTAWLDLARIGYERVVGTLVADPEAWKSAGLEVRSTESVEPCCLDAWVSEGRTLLDVRTAGERDRGAVPGSIWIPLSSLEGRLSELPAGPIAILCGTGYRSTIAVSLLERAGRTGVVNSRGGWAAYSERACSEPDSQDLFCRDLFDRFPAAA